jgi:hypothetical protein
MSATKLLSNFPDLKEFYPQGGGRRYVTPEGHQYPSVTTVIGAQSDKTGLDEWRARVGDKEADRISRKARNRGQLLHDICEKYALGEEGFDAGYFPDVIAMFESMRYVFDEDVTEVVGTEIPMYSDHLETAGRTDLVAKYKNRLAIIDYKNSMKPKKAEWIRNYFIQTSVYCVMFEERTGVPIADIVIIMAIEGNPRAEVFHGKRDEFIGDFIQMRKDYAKGRYFNYNSRFSGAPDSV